MLSQLNVTICSVLLKIFYSSTHTAHFEYLSQHIANNIFVFFSPTPLRSCGLLTLISALNTSPIARSHLSMYICGSNGQHRQCVLSYIIWHDA